jgi:type IV pilus assembly protein PilB
MGVEPFLLAATLEAIIAQRLVRRICTDCKEYYEPGEEQRMALKLTPEDLAGKRFAFGTGCESCNNTGHRGRTAIFEMMLMSDKIRQMIMDNASTGDMREQSRREGMRSLRESGLLAIYDNKTTVEEVVRETLLLED